MKKKVSIAAWLVGNVLSYRSGYLAGYDDGFQAGINEALDSIDRAKKNQEQTT